LPDAVLRNVVWVLKKGLLGVDLKRVKKGGGTANRTRFLKGMPFKVLKYVVPAANFVKADRAGK